MTSACSLCSIALPHMIVVCHGVSPRAASISLELLAKCSLRHSTVALQLGDRSISRSQVLKQVRTFVENQPIFYKSSYCSAITTGQISTHTLRYSASTGSSTHCCALLRCHCPCCSVVCMLELPSHQHPTSASHTQYSDIYDHLSV